MKKVDLNQMRMDLTPSVAYKNAIMIDKKLAEFFVANSSVRSTSEALVSNLCNVMYENKFVHDEVIKKRFGTIAEMLKNKKEMLVDVRLMLDEIEREINQQEESLNGYLVEIASEAKDESNQ
jgi:hypothetical protein